MSPAAPCTLDRVGIEAHQIRKLRLLLDALVPRNRFYTAKLEGAGAGLAANLASLVEFTASVPFTFKGELVDDQAKNPPYGSNLTYPLECYNRFNQTSGTTGRPMRWLDTRESWDWMLECWTRVYHSAGTRPDDRVFFPFSFGPFLGFWVAFEAAARMGCLSIPGGGMRSAARLRTILDNGVTVLCSTPTYAVRLAEVAAEENIDLGSGKVRSIIVAGEPGGSIPATRALIEKLWPGARVADHHGMTEIGPVTYECPERRGVLHIMEAAYFPEVIDPDSQEPAAPGGTGELVLTNLGRTGSPLLRYRTGDIVRRASEARCLCGSYEMALDGGILARSDDMVVVRGVNLYPSAVEEILRSCGGVAEFRVETWTDRALSEMRIQLEPESAREDPARLGDRVEAALRNALGLRVPVSCVSPGALPRFEAKARRWVRR
ncbi:MAG: phenylacetate--CoA ligase family protein [Bryobacteraceae bacterium]